MDSLFNNGNRFDDDDDDDDEEEIEEEYSDEEETAGGIIGQDTSEDAVYESVSRIVEEDYDIIDQVVEEDEGEVTKPPRKPVPLAGVARIQLDASAANNAAMDPPEGALLEPLVEAVFQRGYQPGLGLDSRDILAYRLKRVLFDEPNFDNEDEDSPTDKSRSVLTWLTKPLIQALLNNTTENLTMKVAPFSTGIGNSMEPQSLLHWVCQWKLLQLQCGWRGHDDMVDLLLSAGAPVNAVTSLKCTPLFFAVKYGTVDTCRLLLEAGADVRHKDTRKQTCLRNTLPQANPYILKLLIRHGLPVLTETFVVTETLESQANPKKKQPKLRINALDVLLTEFVTPHPDVSWATLGMASIDDYALCIIMLLQQGLQLSPHYPDATYFLGHYLQGSVKSLKRAYYTIRIAALFTGQWLPPAALDQVALWKDDGNAEDRKSSKSDHNDGGVASVEQKEATKATGDAQAQRRMGLSRLTLEQLQFECEARSIVVAQKNVKKNCIDSILHDWQEFTLPQGFDEGDIDDNPSSRLVPELTLQNTMISEDNYLWVAASNGCTMIPIVVKGIPIFALLSTTSPYTVLSPHFVKTYGLQLNPELQLMTTESPLKFVRADDDSQHPNQNDFPRSNDPADAPQRPRPRVITAPHVCLTSVRDFRFTLGKSGIKVCLPSAMQAYEPQSLNWPAGVILGLDFIRSAAWVQINVEVDLEVCLGRTVGLLTGHAESTSPGLTFDLIEPHRANQVEQDVRYYSNDGKIFWSPLWHISLSSNDNCLSMGQYLQESLPYSKERENTSEKGGIATTVCNWCYRKFPCVPLEREHSWMDWILSRPMSSGMLHFKNCREEEGTTYYYCNNDCWQQARELHSTQADKNMELPIKLSKRGNYKAQFLKFLIIILLAGSILAGVFLVSISGSDIKGDNSVDSIFLEDFALGMEEEL